MAMKPDALFAVDTLGTRWHIERLDEQSWTSSQIAQLTAVMIAFNDNYTGLPTPLTLGNLICTISSGAHRKNCLICFDLPNKCIP